MLPSVAQMDEALIRNGFQFYKVCCGGKRKYRKGSDNKVIFKTGGRIWEYYKDFRRVKIGLYNQLEQYLKSVN